MREILRRENSPARMAWSHSLELDPVGIGALDTYVGADLVASWHRRNIMIFANLKAAAEPGDLILVIYGAGHATIMRQLIEADPSMVLVEPNDYL